MPPAAIWKKKRKKLQRAYYPQKGLIGRVVHRKTQLVATKIRVSLVIVYAIAALDLEPWILSPSCRSSDATTATKDLILWSRQPICARPDSHSLLVFSCTSSPNRSWCRVALVYSPLDPSWGHIKRKEMALSLLHILNYASTLCT